MGQVKFMHTIDINVTVFIVLQDYQMAFNRSIVEPGQIEQNCIADVILFIFSTMKETTTCTKLEN